MGSSVFARIYEFAMDRFSGSDVVERITATERLAVTNPSIRRETCAFQSSWKGACPYRKPKTGDRDPDMADTTDTANVIIRPPIAWAVAVVAGLALNWLMPLLFPASPAGMAAAMERARSLIASCIRALLASDMLCSPLVIDRKILA